jgi:trypsin
LISDADCKAIWGRQRITPQSVCVGGPSSSTGACNGDSGGPLVQNGVLIGNTSWGASSCDASEYPTIYSKNAAVADWIQQQM